MTPLRNGWTRLLNGGVGTCRNKEKVLLARRDILRPVLSYIDHEIQCKISIESCQSIIWKSNWKVSSMIGDSKSCPDFNFLRPGRSMIKTLELQTQDSEQ